MVWLWGPPNVELYPHLFIWSSGNKLLNYYVSCWFDECILMTILHYLGINQSLRASYFLLSLTTECHVIIQLLMFNVNQSHFLIISSLSRRKMFLTRFGSCFYVTLTFEVSSCYGLVTFDRIYRNSFKNIYLSTYAVTSKLYSISEKILQTNFPQEDTLFPWSSKIFKGDLSSMHPNINFSTEKEKMLI